MNLSRVCRSYVPMFSFCLCNISRMEVFHCHAPLFSFCPVPGVAAIIQRRCETALLFGRVRAPVSPQRKFPHKSPAPKGAGLFCAYLRLAAYTSSMMAISAASPRRTPVFTMRV